MDHEVVIVCRGRTSARQKMKRVNFWWGMDRCVMERNCRVGDMVCVGRSVADEHLADS